MCVIKVVSRAKHASNNSLVHNKKFDRHVYYKKVTIDNILKCHNYEESLMLH